MTPPPDEDDDATKHDLVAPAYEHAPPTVEIMPSPFHRLAAPEPRIISRTPTAPGGASVIQAPIAVGTEPDPMAGPTHPDGHPILSVESDPGFPAGPWIDATPTQLGPHPTAPLVPPPEAPSILVSQSLMLEAAHRSDEVTPAPKRAPRRRRGHHVPQAGPGPHLPTEVALPAIKRKKAEAKEGSDLPLILGLIGLGLVIALVVAAVSYALVRTMTPERPRIIRTTP